MTLNTITSIRWLKWKIN